MGKTYRRVLQAVALFVIVATAVVSFYLTRDPLVLVFGFIAAAFVEVAMRVIGAGAGMTTTRVKCLACSALNLEDARYCSACGKPI